MIESETVLPNAETLGGIILNANNPTAKSDIFSYSELPDFILAVGSGTINDCCRLASFRLHLPYPLRQLHLLGNPRMYRDTVRRMCQEQEYINDETKEKITAKALTITGKGFQRSVRLLKGAESLHDLFGRILICGNQEV